MATTLIKWLKKEKMSVGLHTKGNGWEAYLSGYADVEGCTVQGSTPNKAIAKLAKNMSGKEVKEWDFFGHDIIRTIKIPKDLTYDIE